VQILDELDIEYDIRDYISNPPDINELKNLSSKLGLHPSEFIRSREADYKQNRLSEFLDNDEILFEKMSKYPKLIERPIIVSGNKAVLGRPVDKVKKFLNTNSL
jgi:arsenate reductase